MAFFEFLGKIFLFPGTAVIGSLNITVEDDGGILRSLINMIFWGVVVVIGALPFMLG